METISSLTSFEIPTVFACRPAGKKCGNFKPGWWLSWFHPLNLEQVIFRLSSLSKVEVHNHLWQPKLNLVNNDSKTIFSQETILHSTTSLDCEEKPDGKHKKNTYVPIVCNSLCYHPIDIAHFISILQFWSIQKPCSSARTK